MRILDKIKDSEFKDLLPYISLQFFEAVSFTEASQVGWAMLKNRANPFAWQKVWSECQSSLDSVIDFWEAQSYSHGERVLFLYFWQVFRKGDQPWILDLSPAAFSESGQWSPRRNFFEFSPEFAEGLRGLYRGYYLGDSELFRTGLASMGLQRLESTIREHFGFGEADLVLFELRNFTKTFEEIVNRAVKEKAKIAGEFLPLGLYLLTLYQNLEKVGEPQPVGKVFRDVMGFLK